MPSCRQSRWLQGACGSQVGQGAGSCGVGGCLCTRRLACCLPTSVLPGRHACSLQASAGKPHLSARTCPLCARWPAPRCGCWSAAGTWAERGGVGPLHLLCKGRRQALGLKRQRLLASISPRTASCHLAPGRLGRLHVLPCLGQALPCPGPGLPRSIRWSIPLARLTCRTCWATCRPRRGCWGRGRSRRSRGRPSARPTTCRQRRRRSTGYCSHAQQQEGVGERWGVWVGVPLRGRAAGAERLATEAGVPSPAQHASRHGAPDAVLGCVVVVSAARRAQGQ